MIWDVFCRVIDNFGDIGVCWRLAGDLSQRGHEVRLWVDEAAALRWMAPQVKWQVSSTLGIETGQGQAGVTVLRWQDAERPVAQWPQLNAGDVVIEAFGCDPPDAFIERMQHRAAQGRPMPWLNLEYLSAQDYVERSHGLVSPVWSGVGVGLSKRFFYPGFTPRTGGLLREPNLIARRQSDTADPKQRQAILATLGVVIQPEDLVVLVFCYASAPVIALLDRLAQSPRPVHVLLTPGAATQLGRVWQQQQQQQQQQLQPARRTPSAMTIHELPALPQPVFDQLLWCSDLNFVRGEDSAVRALWAARPHIWQIYEQDDGVHADKLDAFMNRWMRDWPTTLRSDVTAWWRAWNKLAPMPDSLPSWEDQDAPWRLASEAARADLLEQQDLVTQLINFVTSSG
jgi:uncharacterized repeat protein (TIGR03837 family)